MFLCLNSKNVIYSLLIITIQLTIILSNEEKCYSIESCLRCPELDLCEECETGFKLNKPKTKCIGKKMKEKKNRFEFIRIIKKIIRIKSIIFKKRKTNSKSK